MSEFSSRVEAQRRLLKIVNDYSWSGEPLIALNEGAIDRWAITNKLDSSSRFLSLLRDASSRIFVMANNSDDPICGAYRISSIELLEIGNKLSVALAN